jgi:hypothetical protein
MSGDNSKHAAIAFGNERRLGRQQRFKPLRHFQTGGRKT